MTPPALPLADLEVIEGAELAHCTTCNQLTLQTVDRVLDVYSDNRVSEVLRRCLACEQTAVVLICT
ncbi:hypothetical protein GKZ68_20695 (plasmid) [Hymenobacter sp. BRD128]|uniref:hypothetical protein n=1 Tax=Hymenobacter sp. BRD128 TaxID=2675878 RepID=UPI00156441AA|nr:hypothetical protein [Hymenobacter sp. BRD128]QKG59103.1 hypothetical protein GKZ68_20695 [Hymenobacter sp. BRD128]